MTTVVDASVNTAAPVDSGQEGRWGRWYTWLRPVGRSGVGSGGAGNILRRLERGEEISRIEASSAHGDLLRLDMELFPRAPFAERIWALRGNLTSYEAWYVALAEALDCSLATLDRMLSRASGPTCEIIAPPRSYRQGQSVPGPDKHHPGSNWAAARPQSKTHPRHSSMGRMAIHSQSSRVGCDRRCGAGMLLLRAQRAGGDGAADGCGVPAAPRCVPAGNRSIGGATVECW